ncbi:SAM-dependent methyltransferase [Arthrobacter sp. Leaf337]|uniref:class I SAM-dependent methyltransferase n=1 Tax=Arthrobacter sp. Leaf337 TaxID=1736342 RepID=UPI0006F84AA3|nr:class I SAM-dependent methyltransferase [Arthrobacter sp. Leaf337]KQR63575.1 SAM-dependent methyltransferase [Arthrobacter sp. Leaf337]
MDQTAHTFGKGYWERRWEQAHDAAPGGLGAGGPNPYLAQEAGGLAPGRALDAGCGTGAEALWLASHGWEVTGADISAAALAQAAESAAKQSVRNGVTWVEADLTSWKPESRFDVVTTHYAHPAMPQLAFYQRIADWVAPGGTLLIVGHRHDHAATGHGSHPPAEATVTLADITGGLDPAMWSIDSARVETRTASGGGGHGAPLHDVVVRATRL